MLNNKIFHWTGSLIAVLVFTWFGKQLVTYSSAFAGLGLTAILYAVVATVSYMVPTIISGLAWWLLLRGVGEHGLFIIEAITINCLTQLGKYLPGNVAHYVGRVVLANRHGLGMNATLFSMFMETLWVITIAAMLALLAVLLVGSRVFGQIPQIPPWWVLAVLVCAAILAPLAGHRLFERFARWWANRKAIEFCSMNMPSLHTFWLVGLLYVLNYLILGLVLLIIATQVFNALDCGIMLLSGIFAVAWIVGYITPGAPAGLGVREVVLVAALTPIYGNETAIGITAVLRVVTVLGDVLSFLFGLFLGKISAASVQKLYNDRK